MKYLLIGDSHCFEIGSKKTEWERCAFPGINSSTFNREHSNPFVADYIVISLGGNDRAFPHMPSNPEQELPLLRKRLNATKVIWFLTRNYDDIRRLQTQIANEHGDLIVDSRDFEISQDGIHLSHNGYLDVVRAIESLTS
jgi:lysophospholipase L1-like esterase